MNDSYCSACGRALSLDTKYCPACGTMLVADVPGAARTSSNHVDTGGGDIAESFNLSNSFNVNNFTGTGGQVPTKMQRTTERKLPLSDPPLWITVLGVLGSVASIGAGIAALHQDVLVYSLGPIVLGMVIFAMCMFFLQLRKERYLSLGWFKNWSAKSALERSDAGGIYFTRITAECPYCQTPSQMDLVNDQERQPWLVCRRNPRLHRLRFDHTQLPPLETALPASRRRARSVG